MKKSTEEAALSVVEWIGSGVGRVLACDSITIVRWILVGPAAVSGFFAAFYLAALGVGFGQWAFSGMMFGVMVWISLAVGLLGAPVLVVLFGSAMAPAHRSQVAWAIYAAGLVVAAVLANRIPVVLIPVAAAGACAALSVDRLYFKEAK